MGVVLPGKDDLPNFHRARIPGLAGVQTTQSLIPIP